MLSLADIEDALITDVKANITGVKTCETHEKEFDQMLLSALLPRSPFVLIRYGGTNPIEEERYANGASGLNSREFYLSVGSESQRTRKEAQRGNYDLLDDLRERYDGRTMTVGAGAVTLGYKGDRLLFSENNLVVYALVLGWDET
jgi:phage gp37-like protein